MVRWLCESCVAWHWQSPHSASHAGGKDPEETHFETWQHMAAVTHSKACSIEI